MVMSLWIVRAVLNRAPGSLVIKSGTICDDVITTSQGRRLVEQSKNLALPGGVDIEGLKNNTVPRLADDLRLR